jgi:CheY-like chemotaxis protein
MPIRAPLPSLFGLSVLIVDDNPVVIHATRAAAFHLGLAVECACDGQSALAALHAHPVDAVLMDLHMPRLDGIATTRAIRALRTRWAEVPVLGVSGTTETVDRDRCREAGLNGLIGKPVEAGLLAAALASLCVPPGANPPAGRPWFDAEAQAGRDHAERRLQGAASAPTPGGDGAPGPLRRLEEALEEQLALHGGTHPLTRALMRAAGRGPVEAGRPLSPPGR